MTIMVLLPCSGADGITNSVALLVQLYINGLPRVMAASLKSKLCVAAISTMVTAIGSAMLTAIPTSLAMLVACKALQGLAAGVYTSQAYILVSKLYPLEYQGQTSAIISAGEPLALMMYAC